MAEREARRSGVKDDEKEFSMAALQDLIFVAGALPDFLKLAPIVWGLQEGQAPFGARIVYQGCSEDLKKDDPFFRALRLPEIDACLGVRPGSPGYVTARTCEAFEQYLSGRRSSLRGVVVFGEGEYSLACTLAASKLDIPVAYVDAGLRRSDDRRMSEEINRLVTDHLAEVLFVSEPDSLHRLRKEGISAQRVCYVGNVLTDALRELTSVIAGHDVHLNIQIDRHISGLVLVNLSRTDFIRSSRFSNLVELLKAVSADIPVMVLLNGNSVFQLREMEQVEQLENVSNVRLVNNWGYLDYLCLLAKASLVVSDTETVQEETSFLQVPCLLLTDCTTRPSTVTRGTTFLAGENWAGVNWLVELILKKGGKKGHGIEGWDGHAATRILRELTRKWGAGVPIDVVAEDMSVGMAS